MDCDGCHVPTLAPGGDRYSVHDHLFDFSQPPMPCTECHSAGEVDEKTAPPHEFNMKPVAAKEHLTVEEACLRCHSDRDTVWVREKIGTLKFQL